MRPVVWLFALALFFLSPGFACGPAEPEFEFGAAEMRAAVEGTWSLTITPSDGTPTQVTIQIQQAAKTLANAVRSRATNLVRSAHACGDRTLVRSAEACVDITLMPLDVTFVAGDPTFTGMNMSGTVYVYGTKFSSGNLRLVIGAYILEGRVSPDGQVAEPHLGPGGPTGALSIVRSAGP